MKISSPHREAWPKKPKSRSLEGGAQCASAEPDGEQTEHNSGAATRPRKTANRESDPRSVERERSAKADALAPVSPPALAGQINLSTQRRKTWQE